MLDGIRKFETSSLIWLGIILLVAFGLRWADLGATTHFRYDQGTLSQLALEMAHGESLPLTGIESSAGVPNSPMTVYFLAPFFAISSNPLFVVFVIALWNVLGVAILWGITYRYFGKVAAHTAGFVYAVSPLAITYSRSIWAQDYHTTIILLGIGTGLLGFLEKRYWAQVLCLPLLIIGFQIHFAAWTLLPIYLYFLWVGRKNIQWSALGASLGLTIFSMLPFAIGISQQPAGTSDRASLILSILSDGLTFRWYPLEQVYTLITGTDLKSYPTSNLVIGTWDIATLWHVLALFGVIGLIAIIVRPAWRRYAILVLLWAFVTLVAFVPIWTGSGVYPHYFIPSIPAFALLIALGFATLWDIVGQQASPRLATTGRVFLVGLTATILLTQGIHTLLSYQNHLTTYTVDDGGQTKTPITYVLDVREVLQEFDDIIIMGANPHESNYYVWEPLLYDTATCVRDLLINDGVIDILPGGPFAAVVAPINPINEGYEVPERYQHDDPIVIPLREGEDPYIVYPFEEAPEWTETPIIDIEPARFDTGVSLTGYFLGDTFIRLRWYVDSAPGGSYQYFVHFLNQEGEKIGQRDVPFYVGQHWCEGDTLVTGALINLPDNTYSLLIGMYTLDADGGTISRNVIGEDGNIVAESLPVLLENE